MVVSWPKRTARNGNSWPVPSATTVKRWMGTSPASMTRSATSPSFGWSSLSAVTAVGTAHAESNEAVAIPIPRTENHPRNTPATSDHPHRHARIGENGGRGSAHDRQLHRHRVAACRHARGTGDHAAGGIDTQAG